MCKREVHLIALLAVCMSSLAPLAKAADIVWDFENGNTHGFALKCLNPATPASQKPDVAGDESITGVGGSKGLPAAGVAWVVSDLDAFVGLISAVNEGQNVVGGRLVYQNALPKAKGPSQLGQSGYLNTYALSCWGDGLHTQENDQMAGSPLIELGEGSVLTAHALGGTSSYHAPVFEADSAKGYTSGSCGIAVLSAAGVLVDSIAMPSQNWAEYTLDLSGLAGQKIYIEVVDAFAGAWGWMAIDQIRITNAKVVGDSSRPFASAPDPANGATGVSLPMLRWRAGEKAMFHRLSFGTAPELGPANVIAAKLPVTTVTYFYRGVVTPGTTYYWRVDEIEKDGTVHEGYVWSFTMAPITAFDPVPPNGARYVDPVGLQLTWKGGKDAMSHNVYFGTRQEDVAAGTGDTFKGDLPLTSFEPGALQFDTTYYWRVDEITAIETVTGPVWSFTTTLADMGGVKRELWEGIPGTNLDALKLNSRFPGSPADVNDVPDFESPSFSPDKNNYGGRLQAWLHVPVAGDYTFWLASDDNGELYLGQDADSAALIASVPSWTAAQAWDTMTSQRSKPIRLEADRYYLAALWKEGEGGDHCSVAWQGPGVPERTLIKGSYLKPFAALWAYGPRPRNGALDTTQSLELRWTAGVKAAQHDLYFGTDKDAVANATAASTGVYQGRQGLEQTSFNPGALEWNKTYYWRVDEINPGEADSPWVGSVWSFTTAGFLVVDNFEDYVDDVVGRIFQTWIDGWGFTEPAPGNPGNGTGSAVGYGSAPFAEQTIVKSGRQSMPLSYNNADSPYYSETERTWDTPQNWTVNGMNTLSLQVRGYPQLTGVAVTETGGKMSLTGAGADIWGATDEFTYAYKSLSGDATIVAKVTSNGTGSNRWAKGGVMIRDSLNGNSASAQMVLTGGDGNGGAFQNRASTGLDMGANDATSNTTVSAAIAPPYWVKLERSGDTFTGYVSADGNTWTMVGSGEVVMAAPVYIGLCVTSHAAGENRTFQFESIKTTGSVTGAWQGVMIASPTYNSAQDLYVAITDGSNKTAVVSNATAVNSATWTEVQMPLSSFTNVNMTKVKKMFIGVGNRNSPMADGAGMLFIDDIRVIAR